MIVRPIKGLLLGMRTRRASVRRNRTSPTHLRTVHP